MVICTKFLGGVISQNNDAEIVPIWDLGSSS